MFSKTVTTSICALALMLIALPASVLAADKQAGMVIIAAGEVSAHKEGKADRPLKRRSKFYAGETILVGDNGKAQVRFLDGTILSLTSGTALRIDAFSYENKAGTDDANIVTLLKGGFRTITGAVAKKNPANHQVNTPVATIGVRGTNYSVAVGESVYVGVWDGIVFVENDGGSIELGKSLSYSYASIDSTTSAPKGLVDPPQVLVETVAVNEDTQDSKITAIAEVETSENNDQLTSSEETGVAAAAIEAVEVESMNDADTFEAITATKTDMRLTTTEKANATQEGVITFTSSGVTYIADSTSDADGNPVFISETIDANTGFPTKIIRTDTVATSTTIPVGTKNVQWGSWDNAYAQTDPQDPSIKEPLLETVNWMTVEPTGSDVLLSLNTKHAIGTWSGSISPSQFSGSIIGATLDTIDFTSTIDFFSGDIYDTTLIANTSSATSSDIWTVPFIPGSLEGDHFNLVADSAQSQLTSNSINAGSISGNLAGVITGGAAEGIAAQFSLEAESGSILNGQFVTTCTIACP